MSKGDFLVCEMCEKAVSERWRSEPVDEKANPRGYAQIALEHIQRLVVNDGRNRKTH